MFVFLGSYKYSVPIALTLFIYLLFYVYDLVQVVVY